MGLPERQPRAGYPDPSCSSYSQVPSWWGPCLVQDFNIPASLRGIHLNSATDGARVGQRKGPGLGVMLCVLVPSSCVAPGAGAGPADPPKCRASLLASLLRQAVGAQPLSSSAPCDLRGLLCWLQGSPRRANGGEMGPSPTLRKPVLLAECARHPTQVIRTGTGEIPRSCSSCPLTPMS